MTTLTSGETASSSRVAAMPSRPGMRTSISTTSGRSSIARSTAARPSGASPTTSIVSSLESTAVQAGAHQVVVVDEEDADGRHDRRRSPPS